MLPYLERRRNAKIAGRGGLWRLRAWVLSDDYAVRVKKGLASSPIAVDIVEPVRDLLQNSFLNLSKYCFWFPSHIGSNTPCVCVFGGDDGSQK